MTKCPHGKDMTLRCVLCDAEWRSEIDALRDRYDTNWEFKYASACAENERLKEHVRKSLDAMEWAFTDTYEAANRNGVDSTSSTAHTKIHVAIFEARAILRESLNNRELPEVTE